ncbi:response regulator transcription factor [Vallitalea pronyensis]|uniref:Stage 0 sporulation protein A homolog n=1 Tax=Vallitalea pronyensis TaxID=1348613 RepID=A0A8J8MPJ2_9FIRM|nr:response regulator transcription factor [Vallitalea pronyensis]QUI25191.1 response regulator transcription factor [Vallitalea pronyensis]
MLLINVLLVDDQDIILQGLSMILGKANDMTIVGAVRNGQEAINKCKTENVDIVLMDIRMPVVNGVEATQSIKASNPDIKVIMLTTFQDDEYIFNSLKYGASGYLLKDAMPTEISEAIRTVYHGGTLINPTVATKIVNQFKKIAGEEEQASSMDIEQLTIREKDICKLLAEGHNNKEIANVLFLSEGTVKNHITNILSKLQLRDRTQLAIFAVKNKL